jgi:hypothetical protein
VLKTRSVFVLGAGASVPFGFPTGPGLTQTIVQDFEVNGPIHQIMTNILGIDARYVEDFGTRLLN